MADRRRRRRVKSDEDSEELSFSESVSLSEPEAEDENQTDCVAKGAKASDKNEVEKAVAESEYESAEEEEEEELAALDNNTRRKKSSLEDIDSPTELIDEEGEEGGEEGIADAEVEGEFLDGDVLDPSDDEEDDDYVEEERQQGDGEECVPSHPVQEKVLDFDEDKRNPQYIPKKGTFYEHDDRINDEPVKDKEVDPTRDKKKKKLWLDEGKWGHDRYREEEQAPKSRDELISVYGYDIRCEDGPPRARRRRRYGRGPTKYERKWEDENAYSRDRPQAMVQGYGRGGGGGNGGGNGGGRGRGRGRGRGDGGNRGRGGRIYRSGNRNESTEEINSINNNNTASSTSSINSSKDVEEKHGSEEISAENAVTPVIINKNDFPALPTKEEIVSNEQPPDNVNFNRRQPPTQIELSVENNNSVRTQTFENSNLGSKPPPRRGRNPPFRGLIRSAYKKAPVTRGRRGYNRGQYMNKGDMDKRHISPRLMDNQICVLSSGIEKLSVNERADTITAQSSSSAPIQENGKQPPSNKINGNKQQSNSAAQSSRAGADVSSRPKRYSSLRQRSLPETPTFQPTQAPVPAPPPPYYDTTYQAAMFAATEAVTPNTQPQAPGSPPILNPPPYQTFTPSPFQDGYGIRMPVNSPPRLFPQVTMPTGQPMLATSCITPNANLMNFAPPPPPPAGYAQFAYQQYPTPTAPPPPASQPPPDLFRGGITYYYTQGQPQSVRPIHQKRPKAAIPIVPPPENEVKMNDKKDLTSPDGCSNNLVVNMSSPADVDPAIIRTETTSAVQMQSAVEVES